MEKMLTTAALGDDENLSYTIMESDTFLDTNPCRYPVTWMDSTEKGSGLEFVLQPGWVDASDLTLYKTIVGGCMDYCLIQMVLDSDNIVWIHDVEKSSDYAMSMADEISAFIQKSRNALL